MSGQLGRFKSRRGSNRRWMKVQWQVNRSARRDVESG